MEIFFESMRLVVSLFTLKCQCFTGDTLVSTVDGDRRIDEINIGDYIWSYDTETGEKVKAKVTNVSVTETDVLVHVYTDDGEEIKTTMFHPFYVKNVADDKDVSYNGGEWKAASNLSAGDELLTEDGKVVYVKEVRIERLEESIKVYNLEVEGLHTYYVGEGVLVHNMCGVDGEVYVNSTESPVLIDSPYNPDVVENRIKPNYVPNPAHDSSSSLYNPKKTLEPSDAKSVYMNAVRGDMGEWFGINAKGEIYQFFYDGVSGVHFAGIITKYELNDKNSSILKLLGISIKGKKEDDFIGISMKGRGHY